jgi:protein TonB
MSTLLEPVATSTLRTGSELPRESVSAGFAVALALHLAIIGGLLGWAFVEHTNSRWGESSAQAGAISATMVDALPLPPRQRFDKDKVLTSDAPSPAPTPPKAKAEPPPKPDAVLIPDKVKPPTKVAPTPAPEPPKHPQPVAPTLKASITLDNKSVGDRYAYYIRIVNQKLTQNWMVQDADPRLSNGKRAVIVFTINPDGSPAEPKIQTRSGSNSLDISALRAVQRIDTFGPLPGGTPSLVIEWDVDYKQP